MWTSVLKLVLPPQRHSTDSWLLHQEPFIHTAQNKGRKSRKKELVEVERKKERREGGRKEGRREGRKEKKKERR